MYEKSTFYVDELTSRVLKIHRAFGHIANEKLVKLMKRADYDSGLIEIAKNLHCSTCSKFANRFRRSCVTASKAVAGAFNHHIQIDILVYKKGINILHVIDRFSRYCGACVLKSRSADDMIDALIRIWFLPFGIPEIITCDMEGAMRSFKIGDFMTAFNIDFRSAAPGAHWQIGAVERANQTFENMLDLANKTRKNMSFETLVELIAVAKNQLILVSGWSPWELVFGEKQRMFSVHEVKNLLVNLPEQARARLKRVEELKNQFNSLEAREILKRAEARRPPSAVIPTLCISPDMYVDIFEDKLWTGPYKVLAQSGDKNFWILRGVTPVLRSAESIRPHLYAGPEIEISSESCFVVPVAAGDAFGKPEWIAADKREVDGVIANNTLELVDCPEGKIDEVGSKIVRVEKGPEAKHNEKTRWVACEYQSQRCVQRATPTCSKELLRLFLTLVLVCDGVLKFFDVAQAFLQGVFEEGQRLYLRAPRDRQFLDLLPEEWKTGLKEGKKLKILKPLYGCVDSGALWIKTLFKILKDLKYEQSKSEPTLWFRHGENREIISILLVYVDDGAYFIKEVGQSDEFLDKLKSRIKIGTVDILESHMTKKFLGVPITKVDEGFEMNMNDYASEVCSFFKKNESEVRKSIDKRPDGDSISGKVLDFFRSTLGKLFWLCSSVKPQLACLLSKTASEKTVASLRVLLRSVKKLNPANNVLKFKKLNLKSTAKGVEIFLYIYSDASLGNNVDMSTQCGYYIGLGESFDGKTKVTVNPVEWRSAKLRRVTKSTFASELLSFSAAVDKGIYYKILLEELGYRAQLVFLLDSQFILSNISSLNPKVTEHRLKMELACVREALREHNAMIFHVKGEHQVADVLTKVERFNEAMDRILATNEIVVSEFTKITK